MTVEFIGREREILFVQEAIQSESSVLCIRGNGGIGKTRLLSYLSEAIHLDDVYISQVIDFDDPQFHLLENIGLEICKQLGESFFGKYITALNHKRFLELHRASPEYIIQQEKKVERAFLYNYFDAARGRRIVWLFDTTDNLRGSSGPLEYIARLAKNLPKTTIIAAGRDSEKILNFIGSRDNGFKNQLLELLPLNKRECKIYLDQKISQKGISINESLTQKLIQLSEGRIILLDMAVEWLIKEQVPPKWLEQYQIDANVQTNVILPDEFESHLFNHIIEFRDELDRLILLLSKVYPLDREAIQILLSLSENDAVYWLNEAVKFTFIKVIPGGYIKLHDEAERIINQHVWPQLPGKRAIYTRKTAVGYLEKRSATLLNDLNKGSLRSEFVLYTLLLQHLRHLLHLDVQKGYDLFERNVNFAREFFASPSFYKMLLGEMQPFEEKLIPEQRFEIKLIQSEILFNEGQFEKAVNECLTPLITNHLVQQNLQSAKAFAQRGECFFRLGNVDGALKDLQVATDISLTSKNYEWQIKLELALGHIQSAIGDLNSATKHCINALRQALDVNNLESQASAQLELAHLKVLMGEGESALALIEQSIQLWLHLGNKQKYKEGLGKAYFTAGVIHSELGHAQTSFNYLDLAWNILIPLGLDEWQAKIKLERGKLLFVSGQVPLDATAEFEWVRENGIKLYAYKARYFLAQILWSQGNFKLAGEYLKQSLSESIELQDSLINLRILAVLARLAFDAEIGTPSSVKDFEKLFSNYMHSYPNSHYPFEEGIFLTHLGHLSIKEKDFNKALDYYAKGFRNLSKVHYGLNLRQFDLLGQLRFINPKITRLLGTEKTILLCNHLETLWFNEELSILRPEALTFFAQWKQLK